MAVLTAVGQDEPDENIQFLLAKWQLSGLDTNGLRKLELEATKLLRSVKLHIQLAEKL